MAIAMLASGIVLVNADQDSFPFADGHSEVSTLLAMWLDETGVCRDGVDGDPETEGACERREVIAGELKRLGWCYGRKAEADFAHEWHECEGDSIR